MRTVHKWMLDMSGRALNVRRSKVMNPPPATSEGQIQEAIDNWELELKEIQEMDGSTVEVLPETAQITKSPSSAISNELFL